MPIYQLETPDTEEMDEDEEFIEGLDRVQKEYESKMDVICKKYDHPFDNDFIIKIEDLTYDTRNGRRPWTYRTKPETLRLIKKHENEADDCQETQLTAPELEPFSGQASTALMRSIKENPYTDDREGFDTTPNGDLTVFIKTTPAGLPLKATASNMRFIDINNKKCRLQFLGRFNVAALIVDDDETSDNEETSFSEPGITTLEDFYPQMIRNMSRFWKMDIKNKAASNIVQHYRRQTWCKQKSTGMTIYPAPRVGEATSVLESTLLQHQLLSRSALMDPVESQNPSLFLHELGSPVVSFTHQNLSKNSNKTCEFIVGNRAVYRDSPLPRKLQKEKSCVTALFNSSRASSHFCKMSNSPKSITNEGQMAVDLRQLHIPSLNRRKSFSGFPMLQSPKNRVGRANCSITEMTRSPSRFLTSQTLVNVDERRHGSYIEHTEQVAGKSCSLTRRNSFSAFPVALSPNEHFEEIYKKLTQTRRRSDVSLGNAKVQLSNTFSSLVQSPGSVRAKRPLSYDFSFSSSKKPRSAAEAMISISKPSSLGSPKWSQSSSPQCHSGVGSALPSLMWPRSPGSQSHRSFSPGKNGDSPKRTNAGLYRKLTDQEDY